MSSARKLACALLGAGGVGAAGLITALERSVAAGGLDSSRLAHAEHYPWSHAGYLDSFDTLSLRRGYEVYKNVCAACHGLRLHAFRMMPGVYMTKTEALEEAKSFMVEDGPDEEGNMFKREGKLSDYFPNPYPNDAAAAAANGGKVPPDLSLVTLSKHGHENYIFSLLTGYCDPPAGFEVPEGTYFNPYFMGGIIAMPPPLYNEVLEFSDGTPATKSQCAKDVATFLRYVNEPWHDERKRLALKVMPLIVIGFMCTWYMYRSTFSVLHYRTLQYFTPKNPKYTPKHTPDH